MRSQNKIVLVTGGSRGLGKNAAIHLAKIGLDVLITYQSKQEEAKQTVEEIQSLGRKAAGLQLNVGDTSTFEDFFKRLQNTLKDQFETEKIDFLVNNAGIGIGVSFADTTEEQFDTLLNIHFKGVFFFTQKALAYMNDGGGIVNVSSGLARFALPGYGAYAAMKGAMETLTKYQAKELGPRKINVNIVAPGAIETDFRDGAVRDNPEMNKAIASQTALGRVGLPDDIGPVVAFLCSPESKWINGQRIEASGGMFL